MSPTPATAASTAAEAIRALNHATLGGHGYTWPSDVYEVLADLVSLAHRLDQALHQAATWLEVQHQGGRVGHDHGDTHTAAAVAEALHDLAQAQDHTRRLADSLTTAWSATSHLTGIDPTSGRR